VQLSYVSSTIATSVGFSEVSASMATVEMQGNLRLIFSARDGNLLSSVALGPAPVLGPQGDIVFNPQHGPDFSIQLTEGLPRIYNWSAFNAPLVSNVISANGTPGGSQNVAAPTGGVLVGVGSAQVIEFQGGDFKAISQQSASGMTLHRLSDTGVLGAGRFIADTDKTFLAGVTDKATLARGSDQLLLTISAQENGISSYRISPSGTVEWIDSLGAQNGLAVNGLAMLQTVTIGGIDFAILAGTLSSSLTVLRVNPMGVFFETDHVFDTRDTRFDDIAAFDSFVAQGRFFILAGGTDSGLSLFELLGDGTLSHMETFVLEGGVGLTAITGIKTVVLGSSVGVFIVDSGADQIFRFDLALGNLGARIVATGGLATGTAADERLIGSAQGDAISAGAGDDFLHDGAGADTLTGGAGADVFVFAADGTSDRITDFQDGIDRIDVSNWGRIYSASVFTITSTATGAELSYGAERIIITSATNTPLSSATLTDADFIFS
jgi:serralysin